MKKFTLIELIVAMVILGILAAIISINIKDEKKSAKAVQFDVNVRILQDAVSAYHLAYNKYPTIGAQPKVRKKAEIDKEILYTDFLKKNSIEERCFVDYQGTVSCNLNNALSVEDFYIYYGERNLLVLSELKKYDMVILNVDTWRTEDLSVLRSAGVLVMAYMPYSEINQSDAHFINKLTEDSFIYENGNRKTSYSSKVFLLDIETDSFKTAFQSEIDRRLAKGADGVFLDTIDNIEYNNYFDQTYSTKWKNLYISELNKIRTKNPNAVIVQNRGFKTFDYILNQGKEDFVDAVLWENFYYTKKSDIDPFYHVAYDSYTRYQQLGQLVLSVGTDPRESVLEYAKELGFTHYVVPTIPFEDDVTADYGSIEISEPEEVYTEVHKESNIKVGDKFVFGKNKNNNTDLEWTVIKTTTEGIFIYADDIIRNSYNDKLRIIFNDSSESIIRDHLPTDSHYNKESLTLNGDTAWDRSDVRKYLNTTFLSESFTAKEKSQIVLGNRKTLISALELDRSTIGTMPFKYSSNLSKLDASYYNAYGILTKDYIVIPSIEEYIAADRLLGYENMSPEYNLMLRDPDPRENRGRIVYRLDDANGFSTVAANNRNLSVRPALYLKYGEFTGDGSENNPYTVK